MPVDQHPPAPVAWVSLRHQAVTARRKLHVRQPVLIRALQDPGTRCQSGEFLRVGRGGTGLAGQDRHCQNRGRDRTTGLTRQALATGQQHECPVTVAPEALTVDAVALGACDNDPALKKLGLAQQLGGLPRAACSEQAEATSARALSKAGRKGQRKRHQGSPQEPHQISIYTWRSALAPGWVTAPL